MITSAILAAGTVGALPASSDGSGVEPPRMDDCCPAPFAFQGTPFELNRVMMVRLIMACALVLVFAVGAARARVRASRLCLRQVPPPWPAHSPIHRSRRRHSLCGSRRHSRHHSRQPGHSLRYPAPLGRLQRVRRTALARTASIPDPRRRSARADRSSSTSPASERPTPSERIQAMRSSSWSSE